MVVILFICFHLNGSAAIVFVVLIDNNAADLRGKGATGDPAYDKASCIKRRFYVIMVRAMENTETNATPGRASHYTLPDIVIRGTGYQMF